MALAAGYVWGHYGVTRDWFPYPQVVDARRALSGETVDERPAYERDPPPAYRDRAALLRRGVRPAEIAILGDSMLARAEWRELLPELEVANLAIPGDYAAWLKGRIDPVLTSGAKRVVILVGINDVIERRSAAAIHADILETVAALRAADMQVTIVSTLPCSASATHCGNAAEVVADLNAAMAKNSGGARYLDVAKQFAPDGYLLDQYTYDGVHMNLRALLILAQELR